MGRLKHDISPDTSPRTPLPRPLQIVLLALLGILAVVALPPLLRWRQMGEERALSLSNIRRLGTGALLYSQDWDGRLMPSASPVAGGWETWPQILQPYVGAKEIFQNPSNPTTGVTCDPRFHYPVTSSYALNRRFWNTFSPGPFPLESLELSEQTVMFVEAGPFWTAPTRNAHLSDGGAALLEYGDTTDRLQSLVPYPSTHDGRIAVVAADGHGVIVTVEHYDVKTRHDPLYGRIGSNIYNWNGGHPNGETDRPPRD